MPIVKLPDGTRIKFPEGMTPQQMQTIIETKFDLSQIPASTSWPLGTTREAAQSMTPEEISSELNLAKKLAPTKAGMFTGEVQANPWVDPISAITGGIAGGMSGITGLLPKLAGGMRGTIASLLTEPITGTIAEKAGEVHPALALPAAIATGLITGKGIDVISAPGKAKLIPGAEDLFQAAKQEGLPLSPDIFTKSKFTKAVRWISDQIPPGNWEAARMRGKINEKLMLARNDFITDTLKMPPPGTSKEIVEKAKGLYNSVAEKAGGKGTTFTMPNLQEFLEKNIADPDLKLSKKTYDTLITAYKNLTASGRLKIEDITDILSRSWASGKYGKMTGSQIQIHADLHNALNTDIAVMEKIIGPAAFEAQKLASSTFKIGKYAEKSDLIERMLSAATKYDADKQVYTFHPLLFENQLQKNAFRLNKEFAKEPEKLAMINKFAEEMGIAATDMARLSKSTLGKGITWDMFKSGIGAGLMFKQPWLAVPAGFNIIMAHSLMHPKGWMKQWLTIGFKGNAKALPVSQAIKFPTAIEGTIDERE